MPSFYNGLCYVIESNYYFGKVFSQLWITFERNAKVDLESISVWMTYQYDYLSIVNHFFGDYRAFKISLPFGKKKVKNIEFKENQFHHLECEKSNSEYISKQQCLASYMNSISLLVQ